MTSPTSISLSNVLNAFYNDRKSGVLEVSHGTRSLRFHICDGNLAGVVGGTVEYLRAFLLESHTVSEEQWDRATRWAEKNQSDVCSSLLSNGFVTDGILEKLLSLAATELVLSLLLSPSTNVRSVDELPKPNVNHQPLSVPFLLKEAKRRSALWQSLTARIPNDDLVVDKVSAFVERALGAGLSGPGNSDGLTGADKIVYFWANGKKTVEQLAFASCLGRYRVYESLIRLMDLGYLCIAERHGSGEAYKQERRWLKWSLTGVSYIIAAAVLAAFWLYRPGQLSRPIAKQSMITPPLESQLSFRYRGNVETALERYLVLYGHYPASLEKLVDEALLEPDDLIAARIGTSLQYTVQGEQNADYSWQVSKGDP